MIRYSLGLVNSIRAVAPRNPAIEVDSVRPKVLNWDGVGR